MFLSRSDACPSEEQLFPGREIPWGVKNPCFSLDNIRTMLYIKSPFSDPEILPISCRKNV